MARWPWCYVILLKTATFEAICIKFTEARPILSTTTVWPRQSSFWQRTDCGNDACCLCGSWASFLPCKLHKLKCTETHVWQFGIFKKHPQNFKLCKRMGKGEDGMIGDIGWEWKLRSLPTKFYPRVPTTTWCHFLGQVDTDEIDNMWKRWGWFEGQILLHWCSKFLFVFYLPLLTWPSVF